MSAAQLVATLAFTASVAPHVASETEIRFEEPRDGVWSMTWANGKLQLVIAPRALARPDFYELLDDAARSAEEAFETRFDPWSFIQRRLPCSE